MIYPSVYEVGATCRVIWNQWEDLRNLVLSRCPPQCKSRRRRWRKKARVWCWPRVWWTSIHCSAIYLILPTEVAAAVLGYIKVSDCYGKSSFRALQGYWPLCGRYPGRDTSGAVTRCKVGITLIGRILLNLYDCYGRVCSFLWDSQWVAGMRRKET